METEMTRWQEKTAIVFNLMKKKKTKTPLDYRHFLSLYKSNWYDDFRQFLNEDNKFDYEKIDAVMQPIFNYGFEKYSTLKSKEMNQIRKEFLSAEIMPFEVHHVAQVHNLSVNKHKSHRQTTLGGFQIRNMKNNQVKAGRKFELSYLDVCDYLGVDREDAQRYLENYKQKRGIETATNDSYSDDIIEANQTEETKPARIKDDIKQRLVLSPRIAKALCVDYPYFDNLIRIQKDKIYANKKIWIFARSEEFDRDFEILKAQSAKKENK